MVRRRSPSPSGPVRSRAAPAPAPTPRAAPAPTPTPMAGAPQQGPGLMAQMAATAGGVAIGSAVGHAVGNMFTGGSGQQAPAEYAPAPQQNVAQQQPLQQPCEFEWRQFMECTQNQQDVSVCQSFNDIFKQCKSRYTAQ